MNTIITFEIAKLIKEKGFDVECNKYYEYALTSRKNEEDGYSGSFGWKKGELNLQSGYFINNHSKIDNSNSSWLLCSAPTIAEVVMWLYEKHGIWVVVNIGKPHLVKSCMFYANIIKFGIHHKNKHRTIFVNTPTEAYLSAIEHTLNNLI